MEKTVSNIFLHYLNKDTQEIFGISDSQDIKIISRLKRGLNASVLLCSDYCFMPLGFYFECQNTKRLILKNLEFVKEGLLRFCIREYDLKEYVDKKQGQLKKFANDISYQGFYNHEYTRELIQIDPTYLQRNVKVGEYCVEKWVEQHKLFLDNKTGDMYKAYFQIDNIEDIFRITSGIQNAAIETKNGAFIWGVIDEKYKELSISDKVLYQKLRMYFEKYYYEAYLIEYQASILYDFFLVDRGNDFTLKSEYESVANYLWFETFLRCLGLEICLDLPAEKIVEIKYLPEFIMLLDIYVNICTRKSFKNNTNYLRSNVANMSLKNEKGINDLVGKIKEIINRPEIKRSIEYMPTQKKDHSDKNIDVLILIATEEEEKAILNNDTWESYTTKNGYTYFVKTEGMRFALARAIDMRETEVSVVGQYFIDELKPSYISMAGFCAGQAGKTVLGDVIVPHKIYRYGTGKRVSKDIKYPEIDSFKINPIWKQKVERFGETWREKSKIEKPIDYDYQRYIFMTTLSDSEEEISPAKTWKYEEMPDVPRIVQEFKENNYILVNSGKIVLTEEGKNHIENELFEKYWGGHKENIPTTKVGVLATGDDVQQWSEIFDELSKNYDRKTIALDMEAHAIGCMASFNSIPCIIAKGVGDYAQKDKAFDNQYIEYACHMACRFIIEFFNSLVGAELLK